MDQKVANRLVRTSVWSCLAALALGFIGLLGWTTGSTFLTSFVPASLFVTALTAVVLLLATKTAASVDHTQAALASSLMRTRDIFEQAPDGIFVADLEGRYTEVNSAACRMLGYSREELLERTIVDLIPAEEVDRLWRAKSDLLEGAIQVAEWTLVRKDGTLLPVEVGAKKILADGRWQGFVRDITERKRAEEALRASEAKFSTAISLAAEAIIAVDDDQRIAIYNEGARQVFGWAPEEVIGEPLDILVPERLRDLYRQYVRSFVEAPERFTKMGARRGIFGLRKSGEEFPAEGATSKIAAGAVNLLTVVLRDVTAQVRTEKEQQLLVDFSGILATSLDFGETLANVARLAVREFTDCCIVDLVEERGEPRRLMVVHADPAKAEVCRMLERVQPDHANIVKTVIRTRRPLLMPDVPAPFLETVAQSPEHLQALRLLGPTSGILVPMIAHGHLLGALSFITTRLSRRHDAQDLRLAEELASRSALALENARLYETAQKAIRARDDVLGIVAHDLRSPLGTMLLQSDLLRRRGQGPERRTQRPADTIRRTALRMDRLIQDLLDVTRLEAVGLSLETTFVSVREVVLTSLEAHASMAAARALDLRLELAEDAPDVWADHNRLLQVFENLVGNAIKFTAPGGQVTVGAAPRNDEMLFWVADTGAGIAAEDLPRVFDRFWQARKGAHGGAGLGLPIVKGIVEAHGGRLWVDSVVGRGSTFYFVLPAVPERPPWQPQPASGP